jgi:hypothetical protein
MELPETPPRFRQLLLGEMWLVSVASDGLDWTRVSSLKTKRNLLGCLRLLVNVVVPTLVITFEVLRAQVDAKVMVEALVIDIEPAGNVLRVAVMKFSHVASCALETPNVSDQATASARHC